MNESKNFRAIMLSSTFTDLKRHREQVIKAIREFGYKAEIMEESGARADADVIDSSLRMVRNSVAYTLIIGRKYGQTPISPKRNPNRLSISELEFNEAMRLKRPILLFIMDKKHSVTEEDIELDPDKRQKLDAFRERAKRMRGGGEVERVYETFESLEQFSTVAAIAIGRLVRHLEQYETIVQSPTPDAKVMASARTLSNIPIEVPSHFLGRDEDLAAIDAALKRSGHVAITALHGLRGVGKTTLAAAYAERHRGDYRATWWIRAETESAMRADIVRLGMRLGWVAAGAAKRPAVAAVLERLRDEGDGVLLVYDNAKSPDEILEYLPRGGRSRIIVTSNASNWGSVATPVEIGVWSKQVGAEYLIARTGHTAERDAALNLSEALGGSPLAHEVAAADVERSGVSLAEYLRRLETGALSIQALLKEQKKDNDLFLPPGEPLPDASPARADDEITGKHATAPFYSDHAARRDLLNRKAVAETVATMIENVWKQDAKEENIDRTFMVHLHGRWGSGKTSILNFLKDALLSQNFNKLSSISDTIADKSVNPSWIIVDYNAWRNQTLGPAWWTLMETVYRQARDQLGGWLRPDGIRLILWDRWWRIRSSYAPYALAAGLAIVFGLLLIWIWQVYLFGAGKPWFADGLKIIASVVGLIVTVFAFGHNYPIGSARTAKSYLELSRDPLSPLITRYGDLVADVRRPVAVFIDDLDRCNAEFVVELLQTIQTLFRHAKVLYVVAADRDWVCASYLQQYKAFNESIGEPGKSLGHLFVEKVFQLSVEVPRLSETERNQYWNDLINSLPSSKTELSNEISDQVGAELEKAQTESEIVAIVDQYRDDPARADIAATKGFQRMQAAPLVKEREHFLSDYAKLIEPNPRAMKRLLNAYGFRRGFAIQSRQKSDPDALVRWTILENRWPILADYLDGRTSSSEIISALMNKPEVLEVAQGLTWEKLRPVASAPSQPPAAEITPGAATT